MVFESIVVDLLNRYLGEYVENLDKGQLKIGIWGGDVVLKNLVLKQSALKELDLPVQTVYGHLGSLVLKIPWKNLYSAPVEAYIDRLYLLAVPNNSVQYNAEKEEKAVIEAKKNELERIQLAKKLEEEKNKPKTDKSFAEKLSTQIINNVQIKISEIHIRYEDATSCSSPFAFGVSLSNFSVHTTDNNWQKQLVSSSPNEIFKIALLESLAVYMNCNSKMFSNYEEKDYFQFFQNSIASKDSKPTDYEYILGPITSTARLKMCPDPTLNDFSIPKIILNVVMEKLLIGITKTQYQDTMQLIEQFGRMSRGYPYRKHRPYDITYRGHYKEWWRFAYKCIMENEIQRRKQNWSWEHMKKTRELCRLYEDVYKQKLTMKKPTQAVLDAVEMCEKELNLQNLVIIRQKVELEVDKESKEVKEVSSGGWLSSWWSSKKDDGKGNGNDNIKGKFQAAMTPEEKEKLFRAIGYQENAVPAELPENFVAYSLEFALNCLEISVKSNIGIETVVENVILLQLNRVKCEVDQRPSAQSVKLNLNMKELSVFGLQQQQYLPVMIQSQIESSNSLLDVMFESNPLDKTCDQRIKVQSQPIQIVYNGETVIELLKVFQTPQTATLSQLQDAAAEKLIGIKERSATGLQYAIANHRRLEVDIKFSPSYFLIPNGGKYTKNESVIVLSLGQLVLKTEPRPMNSRSVKSMHDEGANSDEILQELIRQSYDKFEFEIQNIQVLVAKSTEDWEEAIQIGRGTEMHILEPSFVKLAASMSVITDDPRLPKCKITCDLPSINISVTEDRFIDMISILVNLPMPESQTPQVTPISKETNLIGSSLSLLKFLDEKQQKLQKRLDPPEALDTLDGVVQFTEVEAYFILEEFTITICKSKPESERGYKEESSSDEFGTPDEFADPTNFVSPSFKSVQFEIPSRSIHDREKMLFVRIKKLELKAAQKSYELNVDLRLGAISFDQFRVINETERKVQVINTPQYDSDFEYLFNLNYINCKKTSPEFVTKYNSVEQMVNIQISTIVFLLNQDGIGELIAIANNFQSRVDDAMSSVSKKRDRIADAGATSFLEAAKEKLPIILEEGNEQESSIIANTTEMKKSSRKNQKIVDSIKLKVNAQMKDVTAEIQNDVRSIAALEVKNLIAGVILKSSYTEVSLKLEDILVTDLNPVTIHPKILSIVGGDAMKIQVILFNMNETSEYNSDNMKIEVTMGCAKIVFLNWFITSVLSFLDHFQTAQEKIKEASKAAAEAAKQNVVAAYEQATRIKLNLKIKAPIIFIPIHSQSLEAIVADLGNLIITNTISNLDVANQHGPAIIDDMKVELNDIKLSKVNLRANESSISISEVNSSISSRFKREDVSYDIDFGDQLLKPTSFALIIRRNLSSGWYKDKPQIEISGRLKTIELNFVASDYQVIMQIVGLNMTEGQSEFKKPKKPSKVTHEQAKVVAEINDDDDDEARLQWRKAQDKLLPSQQPFGLDISSLRTSPTESGMNIVEVAMKFSFQVDSIILNLFTAPNEGLACFGLYYLSLNGQNLVDGSMNVVIVLSDVNLDDTRPGREGKITRFMERKDKNNLDESASNSQDKNQSMIDVTVRLKDNDMFADVKVFSFDLILSVDFLLRLSSFFQPNTSEMSMETSVNFEANRSEQIHRRKRSTDAGSQQQNGSKTITLILHVEEYDVILVEKMDDINCLALILNNEISVKLRMIDEKQIIQGEIKNFTLYLSEFNPLRRNQTKNYVLHPCFFNLNGSTPPNKGLHISINASAIQICVSPATIELMNRIMATLTQQESNEESQNRQMLCYDDLWEPKKFENGDFWFIKVEEGFDVLSLDSLSMTQIVKEEQCIVEIPSIAIKIENGIGVHTIPLLFIETSMNADVANWSSELEISSTLRLIMSYYNHKLALWEPLVEPVEVENSHGLSEFNPWELHFDLKVDKHENELEKSDPTTVMKIYSIETLELLVTKTCLDVLKTLGNAFSKAIDKEGLIKTGIVDAPYVFKNDTGLEIQLEIQGSEFQFHIANFVASDENQLLVFENATLDGNFDKDKVFSCIVYPGGKVYLESKVKVDQTSSLLNKTWSPIASDSSREKFISLYIPELQKRLQLPIHRADKRYFPIYRESNQESWGIISEISIEMGSTIITIRGILQVFNHFTVPVSIHHDFNGRMMEIGRVAPNESFNIPINCVHDKNKEIYFSIAGYRTSTQGMSWKESPGVSNFAKNLQCDPINTYEPLYINSIRERFDVYFEISSKFTLASACYLIRLRPPLVLKNALPLDLVVSMSGCSVIRDKHRNEREYSVDETMTSAHLNSLTGIAGEDFLDYGEKIIKPGELLHLPTIKTAATKRNDNPIYIIAKLVQYLDRLWSIKTEIPSEPEEFGVWTFYSYDSAEVLNLQLGVRYENFNHCKTLTIYCPFWMLNKTGLYLSYRKSRKTEKHEIAGKSPTKADENTNVLYHPPEYEGPILFSFREKAFFGKKKASIRVDSGEWSDKFPIDVAGSSGVVECKSNCMSYQIGVQNILTHNSLTKQIIFMPYFILINRAPFDIEVQEYQRPADPRILVKSDDCVPLWPRSEGCRMLRVKTVDTDEITAPFKYDDVQCSLLKLNNKYGGINVDVHVTEGVIYISFSEYHSGDAPGLIINYTDEEITFWEKGHEVVKTHLKPQNLIYYTWTDPAGERAIVWKNVGKENIENDLRRDGIDEFSITSTIQAASSKQRDGQIENYFWVSFLDGTQRVLLFTKDPSVASNFQSSTGLDQVTRDVEIKLRGLGLSFINNVKGCDLMYIGVASSNVIWEQEKNHRYKPLKIELNQLVEEKYQQYRRDIQVDETANLSKKYLVTSANSMYEIDFLNNVIQKHTSQRRIRRLFYPGFWMNLKSSEHQLQLHAKINRIQIDNQLNDSIFPIILAPIPPPKSIAATTELKPFIECSVVQRIIPHSTVTQFKYLRVLMQEFHVKVDLDFINEILEMLDTATNEAEAKKKFEEDMQVQKQPLFAHVTLHSQQEQKNFYDNLHLGPIKVHVSFSMGTGSESESKVLPGIISTLLQGVGVTLTDVNDVVFRLAFFEREYQFLTQRQLVSECQTHYTGQAVKQLYVLVLGLDVIGNPYGLVIGFTKGVEDLFYEPFQGLIQGPGEFAEGLVLGVRSLFGHTVGGAAGAVSKITGAVGKGIATLTFDKEYQRKRQTQLNKKPTTVQEGLARSGKGLVMGVYDGVTGVLTKPVQGARSEGVQGFFKGIGKGAIGLVARPTAGIADFASGTFDSVKRVTELSDETKKMRPARVLKSDGIVRPYSKKEAEGYKIFRDVDKGKYINSDELIHAEMMVEKEVFLVTNHRLIYVVKNDLFGGWQSEWSHKWDEINSLRIVEKGLEITLEAPKNKSSFSKMFQSSDKLKKLLLVKNLKRCENLLTIMSNIMLKNSTA